ncbi:MAG: hypothetical protein ACOYMP_03770 [Nodosilinea sp.]
MVNLRLRLCLGLMFLLSMVGPKVTMAASPGKAEVTSDISQVPSMPVMSFAAYGDIPYLIKLPNGRTDDQVLTEDIAPALRRREDIPFVIHLGDLSRPETACSDDWLRQSQTFWQREVVKPVFYTPGDNDWADCDRESLAVRQSEIERLQQLRTILFSSPKTVTPGWQLEEVQKILTRDPEFTHPENSLGAIRRVLAMTPGQFAREWRYETQPELPENAIWWRDGVLFVTVHMISTDNGRTEILIDDPKRAIALVDERDRQNQRWLNRAFELAQKQDTKAVVVATQLDPFGPAIQQETPLSRCLSNPAYAGFCKQVQTLSGGLGKPVLLLHGDTNAYCLDQPFDNSKNLWRLNAPGDFKYIDAVVVKVFPTDLNQPFQVTGLLSGTAAPSVCDYSR